MAEQDEDASRSKDAVVDKDTSLKSVAPVVPDDQLGPSTTVRQETDVDDREAACVREFDRYYSEREPLLRSEAESEKNLDSALIAISTLALGSLFTVFKDYGGGGTFDAFRISASVLLFLCLISALLDRAISYWAHLAWRKRIDEEFTHWVARGPKAWERLEKWYDERRSFKLLGPLKVFSGICLVVGLGVLVFILPALGRLDERTTGPVQSAVRPSGQSSTANVNVEASRGGESEIEAKVELILKDGRFSSRSVAGQIPSTQQVHENRREE